MANVLFLARLYKPHVGGVEKHLNKISQILSSRHKITIVTELHDTNLPEHEILPEAEVFRIPVSGCPEKSKKWIIWKWFLQHRDLIKSSDIIHSHDVFFWILPFRFFYPKRYFITFHGYEGIKGPSFQQIIWHKIGEIFTHGNLCIGGFFPKWYFTKPDQISFGATDTHSLSTHKNSKAIFVGRLDYDTGILDYIKAAQELKLSLDIYGDGPLISQAKSLAKSGNQNIRFFGFDPKAATYINKYTYAFISRYLGILESLSSKTLVLSHYNSAIKYDYLTETPFVDWTFVCGDTSEIVNHIKNYRKNPDLFKNMIQNGYNWARKQTWDHLAAVYEILWQQKN